MSYTFVTTFRKEDYDVYGKKMLESVESKWKPGDTKLIVYVEGYDNFDELPANDFSSVIEYRHIESIDARTSFIERHKDKNGRFAEAPYNYRMDALRFCHKVFALTDVALEMINNQDQTWLAWIDADTVTKKMFKAEDAAKIMIPEVDLIHLGRIDIDYSETGFMAFNMAYHNACSLLVDLRGAYDTDEVFAYREWTDAFVFTRLLKIYEAHGAKVRNLSEGVRGLSVFENCMLDEYFTHNKGNLKFEEPANTELSKDMPADAKQGPKRYKQLATMVRHYSEGLETFTIVETGTWNGGRAIEMALAAFESVDKVHYRGFDLFESATDETDKLELNVKGHNAADAVEQRLDAFSKKMLENGKVFHWHLYPGNTNETMTQSRFDDVDFAFIDGGHSLETVKNDYSFLKKVPVVIFDDFYSTRDEKGIPEEHQGIIKTFEGIKSRKKKVLPSEDPTAMGGTVHLAVVLDKKAKDLPSELTRVPIIVKPKDCMPQGHIKDNIRYNVEKIGNFDWVQHYKPTDEHVIIVSGGKLDMEEIKKVQQETGGKIWCVKHAYPRLLEAGIKPYACTILDPRSIEGLSTHGIVRTDLFKDIDPSTLFIVASMTDISVVDYIMDKTDRVMGFHAFTDALRDESITDKFVMDKELPIKPGTALVSGGTAAATRTVGLLETLGYRNMHLFGFDCSVDKATAKENADSKDEAGNPKYMHVEVGGDQHFTTGELLALAQDLEKMFEKKDLALNIKFYGEGSLARSVWNLSYYNTEMKTFEEFVNE